MSRVTVGHSSPSPEMMASPKEKMSRVWRSPPPIQKKPQLVKKVHWCVWFIVWSIANAYTWKILICFLTLIKETLIYSVNAAEFIKSGHYKRMPRVTVGETRWRTLTAQWPWVPSIGHNLKPFTGKGDVFIWVKNSRLGRKPQTIRKHIKNEIWPECRGFISTSTDAIIWLRYCRNVIRY